MLNDVDISDYIVPTDLDGLSLLKAGRFDKQYPVKVSTFGWSDLYRRSPYLLRAHSRTD